MKKHLLISVLLFSSIYFFLGSWAIANQETTSSSRDQAIEQVLAEFQRNPKKILQKLPTKWNSKGAIDSPKRIELLNPSAFVIHSKLRHRIMLHGIRNHTPFLTHAAIDLENEDPTEVIESPELLSNTLEEMEKNHLTHGSTPIDAWSGHYWPYLFGVVANRYADPTFPQSDDWKMNLRYVNEEGRSLLEILARNDPSTIDTLSPAEKYDALTGHINGALTPAMWDSVRKMEDENGSIDDWEGICEGWSSAAIRTPRPIHTISLPDPSGRMIHFYPSDIKALASLLWAWGDYPTRFAGSRCEEEDPATDSNGRITDPDCFEINPATWHLIITHQIGRLHHSFIMDASYDVEVWNQPVKKYFYTYFNPKTGRPTTQLADAKVSLSRYDNDKFTTYRSKEASSVVGVVMDVTFVTENESPTQAPTDQASNDSFTTVRYFYDLELNSQDQVIGGEWYHNAHPNFVWLPEPETEAESVAEADATEAWSGTEAVPHTWIKAAQKAAQANQPLAKLVKVLQGLASKG